MLRKRGDRFRQCARINLKLAGWWPMVASAVGLGTFYTLELVFHLHSAPQDLTFTRRAIETIAPLAFALQVAFVLGPDNEPAMELLASYPSPLQDQFWDRALLVGVLQAGIALIATLLFAATWHSESIWIALIRWLPAGIFLGGVAVFTTQLTRQGVFGMLLGTLYWAASLYGGDRLLKKWPWFWPFHVYLQPEKYGITVYLLNRLSLLAIGIGLTLLALTFLKNEDRLLGNR